jgi:hypothetical protein
MPFPTGQSGHFTSGEYPHSEAQIDGLRRNKASHHRKKTADGWIGRGVQLARNERLLKSVYVHRNIPQIREFRRTARVIHVSVR